MSEQETSAENSQFGIKHLQKKMFLWMPLSVPPLLFTCGVLIKHKNIIFPEFIVSFLGPALPIAICIIIFFGFILMAGIISTLGVKTHKSSALNRMDRLKILAIGSINIALYFAAIQFIPDSKYKPVASFVLLICLFFLFKRAREHYWPDFFKMKVQSTQDIEKIKYNTNHLKWICLGAWLLAISSCKFLGLK